jgi:hypothetical protein
LRSGLESEDFLQVPEIKESLNSRGPKIGIYFIYRSSKMPRRHTLWSKGWGVSSPKVVFTAFSASMLIYHDAELFKVG